MLSACPLSRILRHHNGSRQAEAGHKVTGPECGHWPIGQWPRPRVIRFSCQTAQVNAPPPVFFERPAFALQATTGEPGNRYRPCSLSGPGEAASLFHPPRGLGSPPKNEGNGAHPISGLSEIGPVTCASRVNPTCDGARGLRGPLRPPLRSGGLGRRAKARAPECRRCASRRSIRSSVRELAQA